MLPREPGGNPYVKGGALAGHRGKIYGSTHQFRDLFTNRKADASACIFLFMVEPLEEAEYLFGVFFIDANAIVLNVELPAAILSMRRYPDMRAAAFAGELDSILYQVL